ncbi:MAG TPA: Na+/H+ antiporter NhaA [Trebonia sp.]
MTEPEQAVRAQASTAQEDPAPPDQTGASRDQGTPAPVAPAASGQTSTAWSGSGKTPLRQFLRTETGSATILVAATAAALIWYNVAGGSYDTFWTTRLSAGADGHGIAMDLRVFVNSGLMALFFLVVGLEARREWDMGELRVRSRVTLPFLVGLGGMVVPIGIFLALNAGRPTVHGWGAAASTDTAFALGALALAGGSRLPDRVRTYLLTFSVVDDLLGLAVIAIFYSSHVRWLPLLIGVLLLAADAVATRRGLSNGPVFLLVALASWVAFFESGVDPIVSGLAIGLLTCAYPAARLDLEQATDAFRLFREQPTARLAVEARDAARSAISPNERLQERYHGLTSYIIVPLFALANADIKITSSFLAHAYTSPATLGIMIGYVAGKPIGTAGTAWLVTRMTRGRLKPPVGWGAVTGVGTVAGIGFTVAFLVSSLAFHGTELAEAKLGILSGAVLATLLTWVVFHGLDRLPPRTRLRALLGTASTLTDLAVPVDPDRDHIRGPKKDAVVTLVEYGDFECPYCGQAEPVVRDLIGQFGELRFVFRHLPLTEVHQHAQLAAEAAEAASAQGKFWEMHDLLMDHQGALTVRDLAGYAAELGLDAGTFRNDLFRHSYSYRIAEDVDSADLATVSGTPTFFINGNRYYGAFDLAGLTEAVHTAKARAILDAR